MQPSGGSARLMFLRKIRRFPKNSSSIPRVAYDLFEPLLQSIVLDRKVNAVECHRVACRCGGKLYHYPVKNDELLVLVMCHEGIGDHCADWIDRGAKAGWDIDGDGNFVFQTAADAIRFRRGTANLDLSMVSKSVVGRAFSRIWDN
jgi:hypothetical protein